MEIIETGLISKKTIIALGAESAGNFSVFKNGTIYRSGDFGDLLDENNFKKYKRTLDDFLKKEENNPSIILTDLHPEYATTLLGKELAKKYKAKHIQIQHHIAHIFSQMGKYMGIPNSKFQIPNSIYGIALDGTGYGTNGKIWGGECFAISNFQFPISNQFSNSNDKISKQKMQVERIGHLENQMMIGGELAIKEPARMLIAIIAKVKSQKSKVKNSIQKSKLEDNKEFVYSFVKKYYSRNDFELLWNQLEQNFNCQETSSTGRVLDAIAVLLGFAKNERNFKHEATYLLEKNSTKPYTNLKPIILEIKNSKLKIDSKFKIQNSKFILKTTPLFEYLVKNLHKDKHRLAATAQLYIAQGLDEIIKYHTSNHIHNVIPAKAGIQKIETTQNLDLDSRLHGNDKDINLVILSGGISNNKIISEYFEKSENKKPGIPRGDAGLSFGQIVYLLSS